MDVGTLKNKLMETLDSSDKDKLTLMDLRMYADILKTVSEIQTKSYAEVMAELISGIHNPMPQLAVLGGLKGDA